MSKTSPVSVPNPIAMAEPSLDAAAMMAADSLPSAPHPNETLLQPAAAAPSAILLDDLQVPCEESKQEFYPLCVPNDVPLDRDDIVITHAQV